MNNSKGRLGLFPGRPFLGVEINDTAVKVAEVSAGRSGSCRVRSGARVPLPPQAVEEGRILDRMAVMQALSKALAAASAGTRRTHFVLPGSLVMVRTLKLPDLASGDLRRLVAFELEHHMHLPFDKPYFDFVKLSGSESGVSGNVKQFKNRADTRGALDEEAGWSEAAAAGEPSASVAMLLEDRPKADDERKEDMAQCEVMLVVAPLEAIEAYASVLRDCQLKPCSIEIKGFSLERVIGLQYPELRQSGTYMVVDVHGAAADVSIYDEGKLRITRSVLVSFRDMEPTDPGRKSAAVGLFAEYEAASESDFEQAGEALAVELERMMSFYRYSLDNRTKEMARIIVTGDVERLADIAEMLNERLSRPAEVMRPFTDSPVPSAAYAVPIGLALRGRRR